MGGRHAEDQDDLNLEDNDDDLNDEDRGDDVDKETLDPDELEELADGKAKMVPHARFHEVNERAKEAERIALEEREARIRLEERMAILQGENKPKEKEAPAFDFDAKEDEYMEAMLEGDTAKAKAIRKEIREADRSQIEAEMENRTSAKIDQRESTRLFMEAAEQAVEDYPFLADGPGQNKEAVADVKVWRDHFINKGDPAHVAISKAAKKVGPIYAEDYTEEELAGKTLSLAELRKRQQAQARTRNASASSQQPPAVKGGMGERGRNRNLSVADLSDEEFDKLTPKEKAELRGDNA